MCLQLECAIRDGNVKGTRNLLYNITDPTTVQHIAFNVSTYLLDNNNGLIFTARQRSLGQGNVYTPVCHSVHGGGGSSVSVPACITGHMIGGSLSRGHL